MKYILDNCKDLFLTHYYLIYFCATFSCLYLLLTLQTMLWFPEKCCGIHETELEVLYKDNKSTFDKLFEKDDSSRFLERNLQKLVTEIFKVKMNLAPKFMKDVLKIPVCQHCVRNDLKPKLRKIHLVRYGIETTSFIGATFWNSLFSDTKECKFLELFKSKILEN